MLRRVDGIGGINGNATWKNFFNGFGYTGIVGTLLRTLLHSVSPDIIIGTKGNAYYEIYEKVNHELSHASHFSTVGAKYWSKYISYIVSCWLKNPNKCYGDGTGNHAELCGIGEMWGYSMGNIQMFEKFFPDTLNYKYPDDPVDGWIKPDPFWDLYRKNVFTKKQIYDCLAPEVDTYDELISKMIDMRPEYEAVIKRIFINHGFSAPSLGEIVNGVSFNSKTVTKNTTVNSELELESRDVIVKNNSNLVFGAKNSITINTPFVIEKGSQFSMSVE